MLSITRNILQSRCYAGRRFTQQNSSRYKSSTITSTKQEQEHESESEIKINTKPQHQRLQKRKPLMKNMFIGVVDTDLLVYPESLNREEQARVVSERKSVEGILGKDGLTDLRQRLAEVGVFGLQSPMNHGGKHLIETELAYFNEIISEDFSTALEAEQHNAIVQILNKFGSEQLKYKCLDVLSSGTKIASSALFELEAPSGATFSTTAALNSTGGHWLINGSKSFVTNGDKAGYLLVLASTENVDTKTNYDTSITAFLVDTSTKGVVSSNPDETLGLNDGKQVNVTFQNVEVPCDNVIGADGKGTEVLVELLKTTRIQTSVLGVYLMKQLLNKLTHYCIETKTGSGHIMEIENIREELSRSTCWIYAAESMIYLTTGLLDDFIDQDAEMEAAITKVFMSEKLLEMSMLPLRLIGPQTLIKGNEFETLLRNAVQFFGRGETLDSIKFFIALAGLHHTGMSAYETIKKDRNPAMNPSHVISKMFDRNTIDTPKQFVNLEHYMHPSLDAAAHWIEFSITRLKLATEHALSRHGIEIVSKHIELVRLADIAVLIYAMVATAARASRSYCIGLRHGEQEICLANAFCRESSDAILRLAKDLEQGPYITNDANHNSLAEYLFGQKTYFFEHPLTRNF
ncbi:complex I assembly factor ACAD9, mitochondrial [Toxorhynchites rutilus septentrionalis]|uniref:complex I assembly factor ACAD9, mitochondrial n=1 Tax=Toxorhynchites rutilus septentrionalis TaxID=329112 RepID=UPI00247B01CA|nr:complex I assembly factor ACAD9, mitochondrial [Toxorhynchites rutilus septentrionalis]